MSTTMKFKNNVGIVSNDTIPIKFEDFVMFIQIKYVQT